MALASSRSLRQRDLTARLLRTAALVDDAGRRWAAAGTCASASRDFGQALPGTRPLASTELLRAAQVLPRRPHRRRPAAVPPRRGTAARTEGRHRQPTLVEPCLRRYAAEAQRQPAQRQALLAEMFEASQLAQGGITSQQIARAAARLARTPGTRRVGEAIRRQQDAGQPLAELKRQRDAPPAQGDARTAAAPRRPRPSWRSIAEARRALADADAALQAASPNYGQLVQEVVGAPPTCCRAGARRGVRLHRARAATGGWVFLLRDGADRRRPARRSAPGADRRPGQALPRQRGAGGRPARRRRSTPPPRQALYAGTLGPVAPALDGAKRPIVVPAGPLLSIPFEVLLTGPAGPGDLAARALADQRRSPSPTCRRAANFVSLRRIAGTSRGAPALVRPRRLPAGHAARRPSAAFPAGACEDSAKLFAGLPPLPFARARAGGGARCWWAARRADELLGAAFTAPACSRRPEGLPRPALRLPRAAADRPALPDRAGHRHLGAAGRADANGALLTASDVSGLDLDADAVILSACNSGGPRRPAGESLSGLARAFFYAGARAMMVTHWSVNDQAPPSWSPTRCGGCKAGDRMALAGSLRGAELGMLARRRQGACRPSSRIRSTGRRSR